MSIERGVGLEDAAPELDKLPLIKPEARAARSLPAVVAFVGLEDRSGMDDRTDTADWLVGYGETTELIRSKDWSHTSVGPIESWSESLRTAVSLVLASSFPTNLIWGDGAVQIWNDAYALVCGEKHPVMFGSDYRECWASAWPAIGAAFAAARAGRTASLENQPMFLDRHGYLEETWFTFCLSPIRGQRGDVAGLFHPVAETSPQMLAERRTRTLRELSNRVAHAGGVPEAIAGTVEVLGGAPLDVPMALVYIREDDAGYAGLGGHCGVDAGASISEREVAIDGDSPIAVAIRDGATIMLDDLVAHYGEVHAGAYAEPLQRALIAPIIPPGTERATGALVLGLSTRLQLDDAYRLFLDLIVQGVTSSLTSAHASEQESARLEALAELAHQRREYEQRLETTNGELAQAVAQLETLARTDPVTGLPNRRTWDEELPRALARARRRSHPLCVALIDLDDLKAFNDNHGHQAGDTMLRDAGAAWRTAVRITDLVTRIGGDEFAVLMPGCSIGLAATVITRLRAATPHSQTCSVGLACWDGTESARALVARADRTLYDQKQGRGRVTERAKARDDWVRPDSSQAQP